jgi:hypothetical protein
MSMQSGINILKVQKTERLYEIKEKQIFGRQF